MAGSAYDAVASVGSAAYSGLSSAASWVGSWFADGGVAPGGFQAFANGAAKVSTPTLGMVGEGRYNEAIVPLPDGNSIPVQMTQSPMDVVRSAIGGAVSSVGNAITGGGGSDNQPVELHIHFDDGTVQQISNRGTYLAKRGAGIGLG